MSGRLCPKIILEGAHFTLKTEIAFALNEHPHVVGARRYRSHSPVITPEWGSAKGHRGLIDFESHEERDMMETFRTWARLFKSQQDDPWIIDQFHISTQVCQFLNHSKAIDFSWLERMLLPLGFHLVLCFRSPRSFTEIHERRIKAMGNPSPYATLRQFVEEQELFLSFGRESLLPRIEVDVSDNDVSGVVESVAVWFMSRSESNVKGGV